MGLGTFLRQGEVSPAGRMTRVGWVNKGWERREEQVARAGAEQTPKDKGSAQSQRQGEGENKNESSNGHRARGW